MIAARSLRCLSNAANLACAVCNSFRALATGSFCPHGGSLKRALAEKRANQGWLRKSTMKDRELAMDAARKAERGGLFQTLSRDRADRDRALIQSTKGEFSCPLSTRSSRASRRRASRRRSTRYAKNSRTPSPRGWGSSSAPTRSSPPSAMRRARPRRSSASRRIAGRRSRLPARRDPPRGRRPRARQDSEDQRPDGSRDP